MILILTQCFPPTLGGIEGMMGGLAAALAESGRSVRVFADPDAAPDAAAHDAAQAYAVRRFGGWKPLRRRLKGRAAAAAAADGATHVIADSWKSLEHFDPAPARAAGGRVICLAHGMELPSAPSAAKAARIAAAYAKADLVLANSSMTRAAAARHAPQDRLRVATPPIPPQPEPSPEALAAMTARLAPARAAAGADGPLIATLGRLEPRKGVDRLIEALPDLGAPRPAVLAIAGDGPDRPRLEALAQARGVAGRTAFLGRVSEEEKAALFAQADLFAMPTRRVGDSVEGFGIVYLEAAWHGAPALAGRDSGAADAVIEGETGLFCDGEDPASVTAALARALGDEAARARMAAAAARRARAQLWRTRLGEFLGEPAGADA